MDDEKDIRDMLSLFMNKFGFDVKAFETVAEAGKAIDQNHFQLALVDLNLQDGSGFEIINKINEQSGNCDVVIITAYDSEDERMKAERLSVKHFLSKPFNRSILQEKLEQMGYEV
ncbi:response regulator [Hyphobacterium sp. CCMP332]|nr:response regulator [Hyphobacterium sp. CCMP332]